jgi:predicted ATP-binding protein involved in virulence
MVGDMILRFYLNQPEIENPSEFTGIVIIDEFDLHWHPKLQIELPSKLSEIFPFVQFIVSTHSAISLLGAPQNTTIIKVNRTKEHGITAEKLAIDVAKLTPNIILTSPIFDMDSITSKSKKTIQDVRTEDDFEGMQKSDSIDKLLKEKEKVEKKYPDSLFA